MTVELTGNSDKELWDQLARFQEVFENLSCRVKIDNTWYESDNVRFIHRTVDQYHYYELRCIEPGPLFGYRMDFGQRQDGGNFFPKRKDKAGNWISNSGWYRWEPDTK